MHEDLRNQLHFPTVRFQPSEMYNHGHGNPLNWQLCHSLLPSRHPSSPRHSWETLGQFLKFSGIYGPFLFVGNIWCVSRTLASTSLILVGMLQWVRRETIQPGDNNALTHSLDSLIGKCLILKRGIRNLDNETLWQGSVC